MFARFWKEQSPSQLAAELLAVSETSHSAGDAPEANACTAADDVCPPISCNQASEAGDAALAAVIGNGSPASCDDKDLDVVVGGQPLPDSHAPLVSRDNSEPDGDDEVDSQLDGDHDSGGQLAGDPDDCRGLDENRDLDDNLDAEDNLDDDRELGDDVDDDREPLWVDERSLDELPAGKIWPEPEPGAGMPARRGSGGAASRGCWSRRKRWPGNRSARRSGCCCWIPGSGAVCRPRILLTWWGSPSTPYINGSSCSSSVAPRG